MSALRVVNGTREQLVAKLENKDTRWQRDPDVEKAPIGRKRCPRCGLWRKYRSFFQPIRDEIGQRGTRPTKTCTPCVQAWNRKQRS